MDNILFCRPDDAHWCVQCCRGRKCCLLGDIGAGKKGCLGYNNRTEDGLTQTSFCRYFICLTSKQLERRKDLFQIIAKFPPGEFKMSDALRILKDKIK